MYVESACYRGQPEQVYSYLPLTFLVVGLVLRGESQLVQQLLDLVVYDHGHDLVHGHD